MAAYAELHEFAQADGGFRQRVLVACVIAAHAVSLEGDAVANHANRMKWAAATMRSPDIEAGRMLWFVISEKENSTIAEIQASTDEEIQAAVDNAVNLFAQG